MKGDRDTKCIEAARIERTDDLPDTNPNGPCTPHFDGIVPLFVNDTTVPTRARLRRVFKSQTGSEFGAELCE